MILSEHASKGNGNKLVIEFLSNLESATSLLDIRKCCVRLKSKVRRECEGQFNIFCNVACKLLICLSCHCCKVRYFGKVVNVTVRLKGKTMFFHLFLRTVIP